MLTAAIALMMGLGEYTCVEIPSLPKTGTLSRAWVTDDNLVVGNWYTHVPPGHAGDVLAKPFVWQDGKLVPLPLAGGEFGHVTAGDSSGLVGEASTKDSYVPVMWKPDPKDGWSKPALTILDSQKGMARAVEWAKNTIWIEDGLNIRKWMDGKITYAKLENFRLVGIDEKGRWFGNTSIGSGRFGGSRESELRATFIDKAGRHELVPQGYETAMLTAINAKGVAIGTAYQKKSLGVVWANGVMREIPGMDWPAAINSEGLIVGYALKPKLHACLLDGDKILDLSAVVPGVTLTEAKSINKSGAILAENGETETGRLFLLTPRK